MSRRNQHRKTAWSPFLIPVVLLLLGFALGWFIRPTMATPEPPAVYLSPVELMELVAAPEPTPEPVSLGTFKIYAYCPCVSCCGEWSAEHPSRAGTDYEQLTASGTVPTEGRTVAADWDVLAAGTEIYIDGHKYTVEDTGSGIVGQALDLFMGIHEDALEWGVREVEVYAG